MIFSKYTSIAFRATGTKRAASFDLIDSHDGFGRFVKRGMSPDTMFDQVLHLYRNCGQVFQFSNFRERIESQNGYILRMASYRLQVVGYKTLFTCFQIDSGAGFGRFVKRDAAFDMIDHDGFGRFV